MPDTDQVQPNNGNEAPLETPNAPAGAEPDLGPNNEKLKDVHPEVVTALSQLVSEYRAEGVVARRHEIKRIRQARMFWQGLQYAWWNNQQQMWVIPFSSETYDERDEEEYPRFMYVTNIYLAFGLSFIAVMSADVPNVTTRPTKASDIRDVTAAKAALDVIDLLEENNKPKDMLTDTAFFLFVDGKIGAYVRYVADGQRFGTRPEPQFESSYQAVGEDSYICPNCLAQSSESDVAASGQLACPQCGQALGEQDMKRADRIAVPSVTATKEVPNGQEVIDIVGGLELNTPVWANKQHEFPYLQWQKEVHRAQLKAAYPHVRDEIQMGGAQGADEVYARTSRLSVSQGLPSVVPGDTLYQLVTFSRTWIRPWAFEAIEDKSVRELTQKLFPHGCYVAFAGETYCESRDEKMDDRWRVMHALPGDGQNRPSVGDPLVDLQQRYNAMNNMAMENFEYGIPPTYLDQEMVSTDAAANQVSEPGALYFVRPRPGTTVAQGIYTPPASEPPQSMALYGQDLAGPVAQFLTGLFPALFGGEMDTQKTATGYAQARDQAMGRIGLVWGRLKQFYADVMMLGVRCFRDNRPDDEELAVLGDDGQWESKILKTTDLQGNLQVIPEGDDNYPRLRSQQRAVLANLFSMFGEDPEFAKSAALPANQELCKNLLGLSEWELPDEDARHKQMREIQQLLKTPPQTLIQPGPTGMPQHIVKSTIPVDQLLDNHAAEFETILAWASSEAGIAARTQNANGFANVRAHAQEHQQALAAAAQKPAQKPPSESINFKDLPIDAQVQMAKQAGIEINPALLVAQQQQERADKAAQATARLAAAKKDSAGQVTGT